MNGFSSCGQSLFARNSRACGVNAPPVMNTIALALGRDAREPRVELHAADARASSGRTGSRRTSRPRASSVERLARAGHRDDVVLAREQRARAIARPRLVVDHEHAGAHRLVARVAAACCATACAVCAPAASRGTSCPSPTVLSTVISPPIARTIRWQIDEAEARADAERLGREERIEDPLRSRAAGCRRRCPRSRRRRRRRRVRRAHADLVARRRGPRGSPAPR